MVAFIAGGDTPFDGVLYDATLAARAALATEASPGKSAIAVVAVDRDSLAAAELIPYPRAMFGPVWAKTIEALSAAGASTIAFDFVLAHSANRFQPDFDREFLIALARNKDLVVLGRTATSLPANPYLGALRFDEGALGLIELARDDDGVYRRAPTRHEIDGEDQTLASLSAAALVRAGHPVSVNEVLLAPTRRLETLPTFSLIDVLRCHDRAPATLAEVFGDRIVFIGSVLADEDRKISADRFLSRARAEPRSEPACPPNRTPPSAPHSQSVPGVFIHAAATESLLNGPVARLAPLSWPTALAGSAALVSAAAALGLSLGLAAIGVGALAAAVWVIEFLALGGGVWLPVGPALVAILGSSLAAYAVRFMLVDRARRRIQSAFARYLSPALVERLAADPSQLRLGGEVREMTFLFCDIRGFTSISEQYQGDPQALTLLINEFLTAMSEVILATGGTIDKYIGDCIFAFWNAPLADTDHAAHACVAAMAMVEELGSLNARLEAATDQGGPRFEPLKMGIGVNTGTCVVGNMGSRSRFDYTAIGDAVNLAARLEGQSKTYQVDIVIGATTQERAGGFATLELDRIRVKGKRELVRIHTLLGGAQTPESETYQALLGRHTEMLLNFRERDWEGAKRALADCREGDKSLAGLYRLYETRIDQYERTPPDADWDGVYEPKTK